MRPFTLPQCPWKSLGSGHLWPCGAWDHCWFCFIPLFLSWLSSFSHSTRSSRFFLWAQHHIRHCRSRAEWFWGSVFMEFSVQWRIVTHLYPTWHPLVLPHYRRCVWENPRGWVSCRYSYYQVTLTICGAELLNFLRQKRLSYIVLDITYLTGYDTCKWPHWRPSRKTMICCNRRTLNVPRASRMSLHPDLSFPMADNFFFQN